MSIANLAKLAGISTKTFYKIRKGSCIGRIYSGGKKATGITGEALVRKRIVSIFDIQSSGKLEEIERLPLVVERGKIK